MRGGTCSSATGTGAGTTATASGALSPLAGAAGALGLAPPPLAARWSSRCASKALPGQAGRAPLGTKTRERPRAWRDTLDSAGLAASYRTPATLNYLDVPSRTVDSDGTVDSDVHMVPSGLRDTTRSRALDAPRRHLSAPSDAACPTRRRGSTQQASPSPTADDHAGGCGRVAPVYSW